MRSTPVSAVRTVSPVAGCSLEEVAAATGVVRSRSAWVTMPPGPLPVMVLEVDAELHRPPPDQWRSRWHRRRRGRPGGLRAVERRAPARPRRGLARPVADEDVARAPSAGAPPATSMLISGLPTVMVSPAAPWSVATRPAKGVGTSTTAFSVVISATGWSTTTTSPSATSQRLISPSVSPSPRSGMRKSRIVSIDQYSSSRATASRIRSASGRKRRRSWRTDTGRRTRRRAGPAPRGSRRPAH